jgi:hypothetical protein
MEKGRLECLNSWRESQGLPDEAPAAPVPPAIIEPATVTSISKDSQALSPALKLQVEAWLWKPLNADALAQLLVDFAAEDADDTRTISLTASRVLGKAGVTVEIETRTESQPLADWNSRIDVIVEGKVLMRERANVVLLRATDLWSYSPFKMRVAEALAARPDTALLIQVFRQARPTAKP